MSKIRSNFHVVIVVGAVTLILGLALGAACTADDPGPVGSQVSSGVVFLDQNWTEANRQSYYTTCQGSAMMPYRIFLHLLDGIDFWPDVAQWLSSEMIF